MRLRKSNLRAVIRPTILSLSSALLLMACEEDPMAPVPTVTGIVTSSATGDPVTGAEVRIGTAAVTTGADGRFELTDLPAGAATLSCTATGFVDFEVAITVTAASSTQDIGLTRIELFEFGDFALYVPASVSTVRGLLIALGGPNTRAFATGGPFGAPIPELEASLQELGQAFRTMAAAHGLALLGTSHFGPAALENSPDSDELLRDAVQTAAATSGRLELPTAPLLVYGMSGGGPQASGFTVRNPERVAGLFLTGPAAVSSVLSGDALRVPTYMILAELDAFVDNAALTSAFEANRDAGALWALVEEPDVPHHSLTPARRQVILNWMSTILDLRLPTAPSEPLREIAENVAWLGDRGTGVVAPFATFPGDRALASWLPSQTTAEEWKAFARFEP